MLATRGLGSPSPGVSAFGFGAVASSVEPPAPVRRRLGAQPRRPPPLISASGSLAARVESRSECAAVALTEGATKPALHSHSFCSVVTTAEIVVIVAVTCAGQSNALTHALSDAQPQLSLSASTETSVQTGSLTKTSPRVTVDVCALVPCESGLALGGSFLAAVEAEGWASCEGRRARVIARGSARYPWVPLRSEGENHLVVSARTALPIQLDARTHTAPPLRSPMVAVALRAQPLRPVALDARTLQPVELRMREQGIRLDVTWKRRP